MYADARARLTSKVDTGIFGSIIVDYTRNYIFGKKSVWQAT
ncbi:hypothetical protein NIES80_22930 [Dolichospermum planctonicum]|jgi:hypothetical protein|uniref:Uncharacterized protein n=1 Tax=Dolichospermum planctonicum TaxID=136072 RepID=A0A480AC90_9CYAN|nr:hypothetical protein NIES80_22930 [Dolichospermum planctonicum]